MFECMVRDGNPPQMWLPQKVFKDNYVNEKNNTVSVNSL